MSTKLHAEIMQSRPFDRVEQEVFLNLQRTANLLALGMADVLKSEGITNAQYNVLRILRGAGPQGHTCGDVAARMVTREPDITRLLDRLEKNGLVTRARDSEDRRVVKVRITKKGLEVTNRLDEPLTEFLEEKLGHMGEESLRMLSQLLERARENVS